MRVTGLTEKERIALAELKAALVRDFRLVELRLFGSKARGDSGPESDIDVLVVLEESDWETKKAAIDLCFDIGLEHDVFIAPVIYSRTRRDSPVTQATSFFRAVVRDGVSL